MAYEIIIPEKDIEQIGEILDSIGIFVEELTPDMRMDEIILDSMSLVSFYVELEEKYGFYLPDDVYSKRLSELTLNSFWTDVISPSLEKKETVGV
ncbi:MAG: hypothetical protein IIY35_02530 [Ruminococcus sp.]|jgi:acyl carrier protein|nr:hypothetical protein [Ruminococcus sp.]